MKKEKPIQPGATPTYLEQLEHYIFELEFTLNFYGDSTNWEEIEIFGFRSELAEDSGMKANRVLSSRPKELDKKVRGVK